MVAVVDMGANGEVALAEEAQSVAVAARVAGECGCMAVAAAAAMKGAPAAEAKVS